MNTAALTNATLQVDAGNVTTVGTGNQEIGGLRFNGGKVVFDAKLPDSITSSTQITVSDNLDISGAGDVEIKIPSSFANDNSDLPSHLKLLEQDTSEALIALVDASGSGVTVTGSGFNLNVRDGDGNLITDEKKISITQDGTTVAEGTYDYGFSASSNGTDADGLYISYQLRELNLLGAGAQALILTPRTGATGLATDLSARVTGAGDLAIVAGAGNKVSLSNNSNNYQGDTIVSSGTLQLADDNVLGQTSNLIVAGSAVANVNGHSQTVGALTLNSGSRLDITAASALNISGAQQAASNVLGSVINAGTLVGGGLINADDADAYVGGKQDQFTGNIILDNGSHMSVNDAQVFNTASSLELTTATDRLTFADLSAAIPGWSGTASGTTSVTLSGLGTVELRDDVSITFTGDNEDFEGLFDVGAGTAAQANEAKNVGTASILADGTFIAQANIDWNFINDVTGTGVFAKTGSANMVVDNALSTFSGHTEVRASSLIVGDTAGSTSTIGGTLETFSGAILSGAGSVAGHVDNAGAIYALNALSAYQNSAPSDLILGSLSSSGLIQLAGETVGNTLTINGSFDSANSLIVINTVLGDDHSATDRLLIGASTGTSMVTVINKGGLGALTTDGIEIITVSGQSTGSFALTGEYIIAGAYKYRLHKDNGSGTSPDSWFLRSQLNVPDPDPDPEYQDGVPLYESYPQSLLSLNGVSTLQQRVGNRFWSGKGNRVIAQGSDAIQPYATQEEAGTYAEGNGIWGRIEGAHNKIDPRFSTSNTTYKQNVLKMQAGIDGLLNEAESGLFIGGIFGQYVHGKTNVKSVHGNGSISTTGYGLGGTLTWYGNEGFYIDAQAQVTWYRSDLSSSSASSTLIADNHGLGYALSAETGKRFALDPDWSITPQAQLVYSHVSFSSFTDNNQSRISLDKAASLQGRMGLTLDHENSWQNAAGLTNRAHVYGIANLYYEFLDGTQVDVDKTSFANKKDRLWGGIGIGGSYSWDDDKYSIYGETLIDTSLSHFGKSTKFQGNIGLRVKW